MHVYNSISIMATLDRQSYRELLWKKIDIARRNAGMSWARLARLMGINRRNLCDMKSKKCEPRPSRCLTIATILGITCDELIDPRIEIPETFRTDPNNVYYPANVEARYQEWRRQQMLGKGFTKDQPGKAEMPDDFTF